ncbi:MAG: CoA transferase [Chloroflexi bacterium]|nr:CoA transferase [Chloroflexota bacterium]
MSTPLDGIRVLDLSSGIAGPLATMLLADFGADVIKVEPPTGDPARALAGFAVWNRNKRSIIIDSTTRGGLQRLHEFLAGADVLVLNQTTVDLDPTLLTARYPRLVLLHMPPYTPDQTPWAGGMESHPLLSAYGGAAWRQSSFGGGPIDLVYPFPLYVQGHWAAGTAVAALIERLRSGVGQVVTVSGMHGIMLSCVGQWNIVPDQQPLPTNVGPGGRHPCYTTYQAGDGQWLFMAALTPKFQANAFKVLGVGDIFADERIKGVPMRMLAPENRAWVRKKLSDAFCTRSRDEWLDALEKGDCPAGPVGERDDWLDHPQLIANHLRVELDDPERGHTIMPGVHLVMTETPGAVRTPAPTFGQHDTTVRPWPPYPVADPASSQPSGRLSPHPVTEGSSSPVPARGPLAGYRVLNLGTILAGPYAGALLAELGADVIKVEAPVGDPFRETGFVYNRGQRGLAVDLTSDAAREAFYEVVRGADVVLDNSRLGVLHRLGIDYANLRRVKPDIVTFSVNGFGEEGPLARKPGFDPVLQAMSGMMQAQGGDSEPYLFTIPINDITAATVSVLGICLGLFHRERSGIGQRTWTSLLGCSAMMQSGELVRFAGRPPAVRGACDFTGPSPLDCFYRTSDGWLRLQARDASALVTAGVIDRGLADAELQAALTERFAPMCTSDALAALSAAGVPAVQARMPHELPGDADLQNLEMFVRLHMHDGTPFFSTGRYVRMSRTSQSAVFTPPGVGEHSTEVLSEAGVEAAEIQALIDAGLVRQGQPFQIAGIQTYR